MSTVSPPGPRSVVPFRTLLAFRRDPLGFLERVAREHDDVAHFRFGRADVYLLSDPELIREVLVTHHRNFVKSRALQRSRMLLGDGLLTSEGDFHLRQRRMIQPSFHRDRIAAYAETMVEYARRRSEGWRNGAGIDMAREMTHLTLAIAGKTLLGVDVEEGDADEIGMALSDALLISDRLTHPLGPLLDRLPVPSTRRLLKGRDRLDGTIRRIIAERRIAPGDRDNLLSTLLQAQDEEGDGARMTDDQVRDEILTIFLAGHETTANALTWTWHLLSEHPAVAERLYTEVDEVLAGRDANAADYPRLAYTRRVLAESMRLYPPAWTIGREPREDFEAGGFHIRRGSIVLMSPWVVHRDARWYVDPDRFDPDRWTPENEAAMPRLVYFPFGAGPRKCIGEGFAWMEGVLVLATIAQRWRPRGIGGPPVPQPLITLRMRGGLPMIAERRGGSDGQALTE
jgi:cytochrome P450